MVHRQDMMLQYSMPEILICLSFVDQTNFWLLLSTNSVFRYITFRLGLGPEFLLEFLWITFDDLHCCYPLWRFTALSYKELHSAWPTS